MPTPAPHRLLVFFVALASGACAAPASRVPSPRDGDGHEASEAHTAREADATLEVSSEPFEPTADDAKLVLSFEGGAPLCSGRATRDAKGKYTVDFVRRTIDLSGSDACGGAFRRGAILTPSARARVDAMLRATATPKEIVAFGPAGETAQARSTMLLVRKDGKVVRYGKGGDPHEGHAQRLRAYLDQAVR